MPILPPSHHIIHLYPTYADPNHVPIQHGDTVEFVLHDRTGPVTVNFPQGSPLVHLVSGSLVEADSIVVTSSLTQPTYPVGGGVLRSTYRYEFPVVPPGPGLPDQPVNTTGELDVTTDPKDEDQKTAK